MGTDIHCIAIDVNGTNISDRGKWADGKTNNPDSEWLDHEGAAFGMRNYGVYAFLAGVRNYSAITPISEPRGIPKDLETGAWVCYHSCSWLSVAELERFDYDAEMEDRRTSGRLANGIRSGALTAPEGQGKRMTWKQFLGSDFFKDLIELRRIEAERIVFGFDS